MVRESVRVPCNLVVGKIFFSKIYFEFVDLDGVGEIRWINITMRVCVWTGDIRNSR